MEWLEEMAHQVPMVSGGTLQNFAEIKALLDSGTELVPAIFETDAAMIRGLEKRAPFHLNKNSTADALIIELYATALRDPEHLEESHAFATSNYTDFSLPNGDRRLPHLDIADLFDEERSGYFYGVDGLDSVLMAALGDKFTELIEETELFDEEPRTLAEILEAEREFFDKVWYVRKLIMFERIDEGREPPLSEEMNARVQAAMQAVEEHYGADNVGPWDDWGWGFVNVKLSALRWVLGSEWDFLDT
jgi:hypothetical protein